MKTPVYADNCQACGAEYLSTDLFAVKLGSYSLSRIKICLSCLASHDDEFDHYLKSAELLLQIPRK